VVRKIPKIMPENPSKLFSPIASLRMIHARADATIGSASTIVETSVAGNRRTPQLRIVCPMSCGPRAKQKIYIQADPDVSGANCLMLDRLYKTKVIVAKVYVRKT